MGTKLGPATGSSPVAQFDEWSNVKFQAHRLRNRLALDDQQRVLTGGSFRAAERFSLSRFSGQHKPVEELIKQADLAMYQVKAVGRNALRFFDPALQASNSTES